MTRQELEHVIRAAGAIANDDLIILGSQSILAQFPQAPAFLLRSLEADISPRTHAEFTDLIDGSIGEGSPFHETFGYYAQGVDRTTAVLPRGWEARLVPIQNDNTRGVTGWCLDIHDLVLSKYVASRAKDIEFNAEVIRHGLVDKQRLLELAVALPIEPDVRGVIKKKIEVAFGKV
jgi:hypothetical protein